MDIENQTKSEYLETIRYRMQWAFNQLMAVKRNDPNYRMLKMRADEEFNNASQKLMMELKQLK